MEVTIKKSIPFIALSWNIPHADPQLRHDMSLKYCRTFMLCIKKGVKSGLCSGSDDIMFE